MMRSRAWAPAPAMAVGPAFFAFAAIFWLATVTPRDHPAEEDVKTAESQSQQRIGKLRGSQRGDRAERQKRHPHDGHDTLRERSTRCDSRTVEQQPHRGQKMAQA